jgi:hypothetical protein
MSPRGDRDKLFGHLCCRRNVLIITLRKKIGYGLFMSERAETVIVGFLDRGMKQGTNEHKESAINPTTTLIEEEREMCDEWRTFKG